MGTNAYLAVRHQGHTGYMYASSDGQNYRVFSEVASTMAAAGLEAVRDRLVRDGGRHEAKDVVMNRRAMGDAYLKSCKNQGQPPFLLSFAMEYEYSDPNFSHGGIIAFFAPDMPWAHHPPEAIEEASFILDLDRGLLSEPEWEPDLAHGSYDAGTMKFCWQLDLKSLEQVDPEQLFLGLIAMAWNDSLPAGEREARLQTTIDQARAGLVEVPSWWANQNAHRPSFRCVEKVSPTLHTLTGIEGHELVLQTTLAFLQHMADELPIFADPDTLWLAVPENDSEEGKEIQVVVDLRASRDVRAQNLVTDLFHALAKKLGVRGVSAGPNHWAEASFYSSQSSSTLGKAEDHWDTALFPENRWRPTFAQLTPEKEAPSIVDLRYLAVVSLDGRRWESSETSRLLEPLAADEWDYLTSLAVELFTCFESAWPGTTAKRWAALSLPQQQTLWEAMKPVDRYRWALLAGLDASQV